MGVKKKVFYTCVAVALFFSMQIDAYAATQYATWSGTGVYRGDDYRCTAKVSDQDAVGTMYRGETKPVSLQYFAKKINTVSWTTGTVNQGTDGSGNVSLYIYGSPAVSVISVKYNYYFDRAYGILIHSKELLAP